MTTEHSDKPNGASVAEPRAAGAGSRRAPACAACLTPEGPQGLQDAPETRSGSATAGSTSDGGPNTAAATTVFEGRAERGPARDGAGGDGVLHLIKQHLPEHDNGIWGDEKKPEIAKGKGWGVNVFPGGEAVIFTRTVSGSTKSENEDEEREHVAKGEGKTGRAAAAAAGRASAKLRRYCAGNGLTRLWTLTYADAPESWEEAWKHVEAFRKRVYAHLGKKVPLAIVPEEGTKSGRKHFHVAAGVYVQKAKLAEIWDHGFVDLRQLKARDGEGGSQAEKSRRVASYLTAYVKKGFLDKHEFGAHRYSITKGFVPEPQRLAYETLQEAVDAVELRAETITNQWWSADNENWQGPPVGILWFDPNPDLC